MSCNHTVLPPLAVFMIVLCWDVENSVAGQEPLVGPGLVSNPPYPLNKTKSVISSVD